MRHDWLDDLLAILDSGSVSAAAQIRNLTQPAFSRRLKALEQVLGVEIVHRARRPATATALLRRNEARIREAAMIQRELIADLRRESRQGENRLVLASQHAITTSFAPRLVKSLTARNDVQVRLRSANRNECFVLLLTRQADLALIYEVTGERRETEREFVDSRRIHEERLIPVCAAAQAETFASGALPEELPIIAYPGDVFLGDVLNGKVLAALAPETKIRQVAVTALTLAALQMSKSGVGLAWLPESLAADELARSTLADLSEVLPTASITLVAMRLSGEHSPLEEKVWAALEGFGCAKG